MTFFDKDSPSKGFVVYSYYGLQSHIIMNSHGVVYSINPYNHEGKVIIFPTREQANEYLAFQTFYTNSAEIKFLAKVEIY